MIHCFEIVEVVIMLTDRWDPDLMKESEADFSAYASRLYGSKSIIPIVGWKNKLTAYYEKTEPTGFLKHQLLIRLSMNALSSLNLD